MRIGHGYDVHRLVEERALILGGVNIPHTHGLLGHSDADVLTHAIMDALLGAAALGDIGKLFPDNDNAYKGADSLVLAAEVAACIRAAGYEIGNVDATVIAERPKLAPHIPLMRERIANALGVEAYGVAADYHTYVGQAYREMREILARNKDYATSILKPNPTYLGEVIPVSGDGNLTNDEDMEPLLS